MECKFCRNELPEDAKFCPVCGAPVEPEEAQVETVEEKEEASGYNAPVEGQQEQTQYQYGAPDQEQTQYQYGTPNQEQTQYQYGAPNQEQTQYQYGAPNQNQYASGSSGQNNYGQPQKPLSGTPYMVFAILTTLFCCLPLGIASIVYASKINSLQRMGDYAGAQNAAKKAKLFSIISAVLGGIVLVIYIIILVMGFDDYSTYDDYMPSAIEDTVDSDDDIDDDDDKRPVVKPAEQSSELGTAWDSYTVQINDTVLTFPCTFADIQAAGLSLDEDYTPADYMVNVDEYELAYFEDANDNEIGVYAVNSTEAAQAIKDCMVGGIFVDEYGLNEGGLTIIFPGGVQIGTDKDTVLANYGEADDVYEGDSLHMYTWYSDDEYYQSCDIDFDADTGLVYQMTMQNFGE